MIHLKKDNLLKQWSVVTSKNESYLIHKNLIQNEMNLIKNNPKLQKNLQKCFLGEVLSCGICKKAFSLRQHEVVAYCGGCYKFLHCGIAGKCVGPNCSFTIKGEQYRQTWCQKLCSQKLHT